MGAETPGGASARTGRGRRDPPHYDARTVGATTQLTNEGGIMTLEGWPPQPMPP